MTASRTRLDGIRYFPELWVEFDREREATSSSEEPSSSSSPYAKVTLEEAQTEAARVSGDATLPVEERMRLVSALCEQHPVASISSYMVLLVRERKAKRSATES